MNLFIFFLVRKWLSTWTLICRYVWKFHPISGTLIICSNATIVISSHQKWFRRSQNSLKIHNVLWKYWMRSRQFHSKCEFTSIKIRMEPGAHGILLTYLMDSAKSSTNSIKNLLFRCKTWQMRMEMQCTCFGREMHLCGAQYWTPSKPLRIELLLGNCFYFRNFN